MANRYGQPALANPYERINVGYFDAKAMQRQGRHDAARENYSKFVQDVANQPFLDSEARQTYLQEQQSNFDEVLSKHAGNLSAGYQDLLGSIEKSRTSPYHNLNKRQVSEAQRQQKLLAQYGPDAIDLSNINQPLYKRDSEGNVTWSDPSQIQANVLKADDYGAIVEKMLADVAANKFTEQSGLGRSSNAFYLMSRITSGERLTPQELQQMALDPSVQQAFLANATTAGVDNRSVPGTNMTYKDMLTSPQGLANFIYGNIQDKQRNSIHEKKQFVKNVGALENYRHKNKKKEIKYEQDLKNYYLRPITGVAGVGHEKVTGKTVEDTKTSLTGTKKALSDIKTDLGENKLKFNELLGRTGATFGNFATPDGKFNKQLASSFLELNGKNPNQVDELELLFRESQDLMRQEDEFGDLVKQGEGRLNRINTKVGDNFMNTLSKEQKQDLKNAGINSTKDLMNLANNLDEDGTANLFGKKIRFGLEGPFSSIGKPQLDFEEYKRLSKGEALAVDFLNFRNDQFSKGMDMDILEKGFFSSDPKSIPYQYNEHWQSIAKGLGAVGTIGQLTDRNGNNILSQRSDVAEFLADNPDLKVKDMQFIMPTTKSANGLTSHIVLHGKDGEKIEIVNAKLDDPTGLSNEFADRMIHQGQSYALNESYDTKDMDGRYYHKGVTNYGEQASDVINLLKDDSPGASMYVPITLEDGSPSRMMFKKLNNGYMSIIGGNENNRRFFTDPNQMFDKSMEDVGKTLYLYNNPKLETNLKFYSSGTKLPGVSSNIKRTKQVDNLLPIE